MLVAIPNFQGRVSPVFDVASRLTVVHVKGQAELGRREVTLFETRPEGIAQALAELGVQVLVCGALSQTLERLLGSAGVRVVAQVCGEVEAVLDAFLHRTLDRPEFSLPGCFRDPLDRRGRKPTVPAARPGPALRPARREARTRRELKPQSPLA